MGIHTKEDEIETEKIYYEILIPIFFNNIGEYKYESILAHTEVSGIILKKGEYKDKEKNTIIIPNETFLISFSSDINLAGIGDGIEPNIARTYSINITIFNSKKRLYRHKEFYNSNLGVGGYIYSRTLEGLKTKLLNKMNEYQEMMKNLTKIN